MGYKILLIDHDPQWSERIAKPLAEAGHELATASDAHEAIQAFETVRPDLTLVVEDSGDLPAAALCVQLKNTEHGRGTPFVFLAHELPQDREELQRRIEHFGCDRMVDRSVPGPQLLRLCIELLESQESSVVSAHEQVATAKLLGSEGLIDAVEKVDNVSNHRAASAVQAPLSAADSATTQSLPTIKEVNRDAPSAEAFEDPLQPALNGMPAGVATSGLSPAGFDESGQDIAEHLDSLFSNGLPGLEAPKPSPPKAQVSPPAPPPAAKPAKPSTPTEKPVAKAKPAPPPAPVAKAKPAPPSAPAAKAKPTPPPAPAPKASTPPTVRAKPPAKPVGRAPKPTAGGSVRVNKPVARPSPPPAAPAPSRAAVAREAPKAVEQLRLPHVPEPEHATQREWRRWFPLAGWIAAAVLGIGLLVAGAYFAFVREDEQAARPRVARAAQTEPAAPELPTPPPLESRPRPVNEETKPSPTTPPPIDSATVAENAAKPTKPEAAPARPAAAARAQRQASTKPPAKAAPPEPRPSSRPPAVATAPAPVTSSQPKRTRPAPQPTEAPAPAEPVPTARTAGAAAAAPATAEPSEIAPPPRQAVPDVKAPLETAPTSVDPTPEPEPQAVPTPRAEPASSPQSGEESPPAQVPAFEPPAVIDRVEPSYSPKAVKGVENPVVVLRLLVDEQGKIARVLVDEGIPGSELEAAAVSAVLRWRFRPATEDGAPVKAWTTVRFVFEP